MRASAGTHGVFREIKEVFIIIIIILLFTIFLEFYAPFTFDLHISSVCRCFNIFPPHLPMDEAGCLQILYHIPVMLEEPWMKHNLLQGYTPNSTQLAFCLQEEATFCTRSCVHMQRKREKEDKEVARGLA